MAMSSKKIFWSERRMMNSFPHIPRTAPTEVTSILRSVHFFLHFQEEILKERFSHLVCPEYKPGMNYYQEFWKLYLQNEILIAQMRECATENHNIQEKIAKYEVTLLQLLITNHLSTYFLCIRRCLKRLRIIWTLSWIRKSIEELLRRLKGNLS